MWRRLLLLWFCGLFSAAVVAEGGAVSDEAALRIVVLDNTPPMTFRDEAGQLTGFSVEIARAVCQEIRARCQFEAIALDELFEMVAAGRADIAAVGLLETPERRGRVLFAKAVYRSVSLWLARPDLAPGTAGVRVAVVRASAQERYARAQGWATVGVRATGDISAALVGGVAQAALVPMVTAFHLQQIDVVRQLGIAPTVMHAPDLGGNASFAIAPQRPELRETFNAALEQLKRNGTYDRINSRFFPFRVS